MIEIDLKELIETSLPGVPAEINKISQHLGTTRVFIQRRQSNEDLTLGAKTGGLVESFFDVECVSEDVDTALDNAETLKDALNGYSTSPIQAMFVDDHSDQYIPKSVGSDDGLNIAALDVRIWWDKE